jgi:hypothetical protein
MYALVLRSIRLTLEPLMTLFRAARFINLVKNITPELHR